MDKKNIKIVIAAAVILLAGVLCFIYLKYFSALKFGNIFNSTEKISEVKIVDGVPRLFVDGKQLNTVWINTYYMVCSQANNQSGCPMYSSDNWVAKMDSIIDEASNNGTGAIMFNIWWGYMNKTASRLSDIGADANLNFANMDKVMDYAARKKIHMMPIFTFYPSAPEWWMKENNFPPFDKNGTCDLCEADSFGNVYNNPSMNNDKVHQDFGAFVQAVVSRYKNHSALLGWDMGIGATGEDNYGPNYISLMGMNGGEKKDMKSLMFTDYSPFFQKEFKKWITAKYKNDQNLQKAWGINLVSLNNLQIPKPAEMIKSGETAPLFPDTSTGWWGIDKSVLTAEGLDFYDFRTEMRVSDRKFYSDLIKKTDPAHILLFNSGDEAVLKDPTLCDGIAGSVNLSFSADTMNVMNNNFYYHIISLVKSAIANKKLVVITGEDEGGTGRMQLYQNTGKWDSIQQLQYIEKMGEAIRCDNGIFAYAVDLLNGDNKAKWLPTWFSKEARETSKKIINYTPDSDCECSLVKDLYKSNSCETKASNSAGCGLIDDAYHSYCNVPKEQENSSVENASPCGDGKCDDFEKSSGMCPGDCK